MWTLPSSRVMRVTFGRVLQGGVEVFEHRLGAVGPRPQISLGKGHHGDEVEVLQHVGDRDVVEVPVAEGREGVDPQVSGGLAPVEGEELVEGQHEVLVNLVVVAVGVISLVLRREQLAQLLHCCHDLRTTHWILFRDVDLAVLVQELATQFRPVDLVASAIHDLLDGVVTGDAHDGPHLITTAVVVR